MLKPGGEAIFQVYNRDLVAERAVEADEGRPRARRCAGAAEVQHRRVPPPASADSARCAIVPERFPVKSRLHGGWKGAVYNGLFVGTFNALPRRARAPLRLASARVLPQMMRFIEGARLRQRLPLRPQRATCRRRGARRAGARAVRPAHRHRRRRPDPLRRRRPTARRCGCSTPTAAGRRCRATACAASRRCCCATTTAPTSTITIHTEGGRQAARRAPGVDGSRQTFRAAMGLPADLRQVTRDRGRRDRCSSS